MTVPGKRAHITQIMIFLYRRLVLPQQKQFSGQNFVFVSEVSTTLCLHSRTFERVEVLLKGQARCLKTAT